MIHGVLGKVESADAEAALGEEDSVPLLLSILNFGRIMFEQRGNPQAISIGLTVCGLMLVIVMAAKCIGAMLPMLAKK